MTAISVLIVDDDRAIIEVLAAVLADEGYVERRVYHGLSALEEAAIAAPDLVFSDIAMPGLDGIALAGRLRDRDIAVVQLSAAMADPAISGVPYVPKPFELDHLLAVAARDLDGQTDQPDPSHPR